MSFGRSGYAKEMMGVYGEPIRRGRHTSGTLIGSISWRLNNVVFQATHPQIRWWVCWVQREGWDTIRTVSPPLSVWRHCLVHTSPTYRSLVKQRAMAHRMELGPNPRHGLWSLEALVDNIPMVF